MGRAHNVFISCSGPRSRWVAEALRDWLPNVIQSAKPWTSDSEIDKGSRWLEEIGKALEAVKIGITCLTPENREAPWIMYEAGALSKTLDPKTRLCTYLLGGLRPQDIKPPLSIFQATKAEKEDTRKLISAINLAINGEDLVPEANLAIAFEKMWPDLEQKLMSMPSPEEVVEAKRTSEEMIAEILELTRDAASSRKKVDWLDAYAPTLQQLFPLLDQALNAAKAGAPHASPPTQTEHSSAIPRIIFGVKVEYEDDIKRVEGTSAVEEAEGRLVILDREAVVARFNRVERWWKESSMAAGR